MSRGATATVAFAALACAAALSACGQGGVDNPLAVTRDYITDGVVDNNGSLACGYLTLAQQSEASKVAGGECRQAFVRADFKLGGQDINTQREVDGLNAHTTVEGSRATVRLSRGGDAVQFRLAKADSAEQQQFQAPNSEWRIAGGGLPFIFHGTAAPPCPQISVPCAFPR
jgi:hypothetical protein